MITHRGKFDYLDYTLRFIGLAAEDDHGVFTFSTEVHVNKAFVVLYLESLDARFRALAHFLHVINRNALLRTHCDT